MKTRAVSGFALFAAFSLLVGCGDYQLTISKDSPTQGPAAGDQEETITRTGSLSINLNGLGGAPIGDQALALESVLPNTPPPPPLPPEPFPGDTGGPSTPAVEVTLTGSTDGKPWEIKNLAPPGSQLVFPEIPIGEVTIHMSFTQGPLLKEGQTTVTVEEGKTANATIELQIVGKTGSVHVEVVDPSSETVPFPCPRSPVPVRTEDGIQCETNGAGWGVKTPPLHQDPEPEQTDPTTPVQTPSDPVFDDGVPQLPVPFDPPAKPEPDMKMCAQVVSFFVDPQTGTEFVASDSCVAEEMLKKGYLPK